MLLSSRVINKKKILLSLKESVDLKGLILLINDF